MIQTMTLTSKRQATLSARLCKEMAVVPGDKLLLQRSEIDGKPAWLILSPKDIEKPWFGSLRKYAVEKSHDMKDVRKSIAQKHESLFDFKPI